MDVVTDAVRLDVVVAMEPSGPTNATRGDGSANQQRINLLTKAVVAGGGRVGATNEANALIWLSLGDVDQLISLLDANPGIDWIQLPWAGVETFAESGLFTKNATFTCAKEIYGSQVGEHALMLILACLRNVTEQARHKMWYQKDPDSIMGKRITILGAGGIAQHLIKFLPNAECNITVLRKNAALSVEGVDRTLSIEELHNVLPTTEILVVAVPLTPETTAIIGEYEFSLLPDGAILINVARGQHVDTDALLKALDGGRLRAAGLDVVEPEPLPDDHPLWQMNNVLITSHCANSLAYASEQLAMQVERNVKQFCQGEPLYGVVDLAKGY